MLQALPESARYLVAAGRTSEAKRVLQHGFKLNGKILPEGKLIQNGTVGLVCRFSGLKVSG